MANYRAVSSGVWSELARWEDDSTGSYVASTVLPGAADIVYANSFTVTLDIDVVVSELRTNAATNVTNGGVFNYGTANSVTANAFAGSNVNCVVASLGTKTFIGNTFGNSTVISAGGNFGALVCNGATLNHIGNSFGATATSTGAHVGVYVGTLLGGGGSATINQYGTATGGISYDPIRQRTSGSANVSTGTFNLFGLAIGSPTSTVNFSAGALNNSTGTMNIETVQFGASVGAVNASTGQLNIQNVILNSNNAMPVVGAFRFTNNTTNSIQVTKINNSTKILVEADTTDIPVAANVRNGVSYANGALTGTLVVPTDDTVTLGIVYDNGTIGTAQNTAASFLSELSSSTDPLAVRLQNVATVQSTGDQIAAAL